MEASFDDYYPETEFEDQDYGRYWKTHRSDFLRENDMRSYLSL